jgi:hypothetical protein
VPAYYFSDNLPTSLIAHVQRALYLSVYPMNIPSQSSVINLIACMISKVVTLYQLNVFANLNVVRQF